MIDCAVTPRTADVRSNQLSVTINPGAPHSYLITFTGYVPPSAGGTCPAGFTTVPPPFTLERSTPVPPFETPLPTTSNVCMFTLTVEKRYIEITTLSLNAVPASMPCGGPAVLFPTLNGYLGPACHLSVTATGIVVLKAGADCTLPLPLLPPDLAALGPGVRIACINGRLLAFGVPAPLVPVTVVVLGPASFARAQSPLADLFFAYIGWCSGVPQDNIYTGPTGTNLILCPTGPGVVTVRACLSGTLIDTQPVICSNVQTFFYA